MREVLIIRFGALGDLALATVLLPAIEADGEPSRVTWVSKERWASLLADDPRIDELVTLAEGESIRALTRRLHPNYDLILDAHGNLRSRMITMHVRGTEFRRIRKDTVARWLFRHGAPRPASLDRRLVDRYLALMELEPGSFRPALHVGDARARAGVAIAVGAAHDAKRWPIENYTGLVRDLVDDGHAVTVIAGPGEETLVEAAVGNSGAAAWDPHRPLGELAREIAGCELLAGNDSGLLHVAEAVGTPVVGLFGPTVRAWGYFPWREESRVLEHDLECRPCSKMGERPCRLPEKICLT
ncbi:MAG: glycosyltransferase family 9 protein, partial [Gemmatimonadetes bacterium]|nr:glycosyltransferase family 9 protein [Gemmatimonadota bacterium]